MLLQASLVVLFLTHAAGLRRATLVVITVVAASWAFEILGSKTGIPFGAYHYTEALEPQLLGVPLLIPLAWLMMLPPAWAVAQRITGRRSGLAFVAISALAFTAWDLFLDPQMVLLGGVGLGRARHVLRYPAGQFCRLADGLCTDHGRRSAPGAA